MVKSLFPSFSKLASKNKVKPKAKLKTKQKEKPASHSSVKKAGASSHPKPAQRSNPAPVKAAHAHHSAPHAEKQKTKPVPSSKKFEVGTRKSVLEVTGDTVCREVACEGLATTGGYCRLHYIKNWKKIKRKEVILREKKLNQYIEELVVKYPDKYIEAIRQDLASDKDFAKVIYDLDLDETVDEFDVESSESVDSLIDTIKREFEDDGDAF